jgi:hypothetical protein
MINYQHSMLFSEKNKVHNLFMKMKFTPYIGNIYG